MPHYMRQFQKVPTAIVIRLGGQGTDFNLIHNSSCINIAFNSYPANFEFRPERHSHMTPG